MQYERSAQWLESRRQYAGKYVLSSNFIIGSWPHYRSKVSSVIHDKYCKEFPCHILNRYPGTGHWFYEPDRPQAYNPPAASLAWDRTLDFLKRSTV